MMNELIKQHSTGRFIAASVFSVCLVSVFSTGCTRSTPIADGGVPDGGSCLGLNEACAISPDNCCKTPDELVCDVGGTRKCVNCKPLNTECGDETMSSGCCQGSDPLTGAFCKWQFTDQKTRCTQCSNQGGGCITFNECCQSDNPDDKIMVCSRDTCRPQCKTNSDCRFDECRDSTGAYFCTCMSNGECVKTECASDSECGTRKCCFGLCKDDCGPSREQYGKFIILKVTGTAYEMGFQQGVLMRNELIEMMEWIEKDPDFSLMFPIAKLLGLIPIAEANSYQDIKDECRGLADGMNSSLMTYEKCLILNFGDVVSGFIDNGVPDKLSCSQAAATGKATKDGKLYHARVLDWDEVKPLLDYPTIIVRNPVDGIPHAYIGFPGNISPYMGINTEGLVIASNAAVPRDITQYSRTGRSNVQMLGQILKLSHNIDEARELIKNSIHMVTCIFEISDGKTGTASVFEMSAKCLGERKTGDAGVVYTTNMFVSPEAAGCDMLPWDPDDPLRYDRYTQLLAPGGVDCLGSPSSYYGEITPEIMISAMRDRQDPYDCSASPPDIFRNYKSIATNGCLFAVLFRPEDRMFWVAAGKIPVPRQEFVGFSLDKLLGIPGAKEVEPKEYPKD